MTTLYVQSPTLYLAGSGVIVGATSVTLTSLTDIYGNVLTMSNFGAIGYITLEPDTTNAEAATFTGVTANANGTYTLTGIKTLIAVSPYTATSGLVRQHSGGTKVVVTDNVAFWDTFVNKNNDSTILGKITLTSTQKMIYDANPTLTDDKEVATKKYVDDVAIAGAPDASTTVKGISEEGTQAEILSKSTTGGTGARLFVNPSTLASTLLSDYKVDTGAANAYVITPAPAITAYTTGQIFSFKAVNANTTTSTLNVNGLGVKTINKNDGATALTANDIKAGQLVVVEYDGTNFLMISPSALALNNNGDGSLLTGITTKLLISPALVDVGTSSTAENNLFSYALAGGVLSTNNSVKVRGFLQITSSGSPSETITLRFKYGATTIASTTFAVTTSNLVHTMIFEFNIYSAGTTGTQSSNLLITGNQTTPASFNYVASSTSSEDSTASKNIIMSAQSGASDANLHIQMRDLVITKLI